jgi:hypothetical protein
MHTTLSGPQRSDPAVLLDLEELLKEQLRLLGAKRLEVETQLSEVRRELDRLGYAPSK